MKCAVIFAVTRYYILSIDGNPFPLFAIVSKSVIEDWGIVVLGVLVIVCILWHRRRSSSRHRFPRKNSGSGEVSQGARASNCSVGKTKYCSKWFGQIGCG